MSKSARERCRNSTAGVLLSLMLSPAHLTTSEGARRPDRRIFETNRGSGRDAACRCALGRATTNALHRTTQIAHGCVRTRRAVARAVLRPWAGRSDTARQLSGFLQEPGRLVTGSSG